MARCVTCIALLATLLVGSQAGGASAMASHVVPGVGRWSLGPSLSGVGRWTFAPSLPAPVTSHQAVVLHDARVLVIGGELHLAGRFPGCRCTTHPPMPGPSRRACTW